MRFLLREGICKEVKILAKNNDELTPEEQIVNKLDILIETDRTKLIMDLLNLKVPGHKIRPLVGCAMKRVTEISKIIKVKRRRKKK